MLLFNNISSCSTGDPAVRPGSVWTGQRTGTRGAVVTVEIALKVPACKWPGESFGFLLISSSFIITNVSLNSYCYWCGGLNWSHKPWAALSYLFFSPEWYEQNDIIDCHHSKRKDTDDNILLKQILNPALKYYIIYYIILKYNLYFKSGYAEDIFKAN